MQTMFHIDYLFNKGGDDVTVVNELQENINMSSLSVSHSVYLSLDIVRS